MTREFARGESDASCRPPKRWRNEFEEDFQSEVPSKRQARPRQLKEDHVPREVPCKSCAIKMAAKGPAFLCRCQISHGSTSCLAWASVKQGCFPLPQNAQVHGRRLQDAAVVHSMNRLEIPNWDRLVFDFKEAMEKTRIPPDPAPLPHLSSGSEMPPLDLNQIREIDILNRLDRVTNRQNMHRHRTEQIGAEVGQQTKQLQQIRKENRLLHNEVRRVHNVLREILDKMHHGNHGNSASMPSSVVGPNSD